MHGQAPGLETGGFSCERMDVGERKWRYYFSAHSDEMRGTVPWNRSNLLQIESKDE